jgi:hypothetical protein
VKPGLDGLDSQQGGHWGKNLVSNDIWQSFGQKFDLANLLSCLANCLR